MIIPTITFLAVVNSINYKHEKLGYQLHNLSQQIYSAISQEELDFLIPCVSSHNLRIYITYYLAEKYKNRFDKEIKGAIADSFISNLQNTLESQLTTNITFKQALTFAYLSFLIQKNNIVLTNIIQHANTLCKFYQNIAISSKSNIIDRELNNLGIETNLIKHLDAFSTEVIKSLTCNDKKILSEAPDIFILAWLFAERWVFLVDDYERVSKIINREFIDDEVVKYLTKKYNLLLTWTKEFEFLLASAYTIGKLKSNNKTIDECIQMFEMFDHLVRPKPSEASDETLLEPPTNRGASENESGISNG